MLLLFSNPVFPEQILRALSWTLFHSLWQGMLLAMVAGGIVFFTKNTSPALRYNLLTGALVIFIISITATFSTQAIKNSPVLQPEQVMPASAIPSPQQVFLPEENKLSLAAGAVDMFNSNAGWIVLVWFVMIVLRSVQLSAGLYGVYQLKKRGTFSAGHYWDNRVTELGRRLQLNKQVLLLQSGIARMPAVIGFFKPVILFPAGMLASLPANEVEAILIHELAHIRRKDFLVNMLQHIVEIIFFFNPAVRWVSSRIRLERENCCDEIAVIQTDNKRNYINALIAFQGFDLQATPSMANAFAGEKNHLMNRVKRIIYNKNKTLNNMEKKFLAAGMIITSVFIFAFSSNNLQQKAIENITPSLQNTGIPVTEKTLPGPEVTGDTVPGRKKDPKTALNGTINSTVNGKTYKIITDENDQVAELYVNGKKIPAEKIASYKSVTDKILAQSSLDMVQAKLDMIQAEKDMERAQKEMEVSEINQEEYEKEMEEAKLEMKIAQVEMERDMQESKVEMEQQAKIDMKHLKLELEQQKKQMAEDMAQTKIAMEQVKKEIQQSKIEMEQSRKEMAQSKRDMEQSEKLQEKIIGDFIKENIIKNKKQLSSYKLSREELIVNGVKQPDLIHKRFKDKYVKGENRTMEYHNEE